MIKLNWFDACHAFMCLFLITFPYVFPGKYGGWWQIIAVGMMCAIVGWIFTGQCLISSTTTGIPDIQRHGITASWIFSFINEGNHLSVGVKRFISLVIDFMYIKSATMFAGEGSLRTFIGTFGIVHLVLESTKT